MIAPKCQLCNKEMLPLPNSTQRRGLEVYVCAEVAPKAKSPCDGWAYKLATGKD